MRRPFDEHIKRKTVSLDGAWRFITDKEGQGEANGYASALPESARNVVVPSVFTTYTGLLEYCGKAWYQREFYFEGGCARLSFDAVMTEAWVYLDGEYLGYHYGGFSAFDFIIKSLGKGYHTLSVLVSNSFDGNSIPHQWVDWYHHGGIPRSVYIEKLEGICTLANHVYYTLSDDLSAAKVHYKAKLFNASGRKKTDIVTFTLSDKDGVVSTVTKEVSVGGYKTAWVETDEFTLENVKLWNTEQANLYTVKAESTFDDLYDRTGFRLVEVKKDGVYLNKKYFEVRGVCRHEDHPDFGFAFPSALMAKDIDILDNMGGNSIRGSHYPNSKYFVDLLDERGVTFWSEIPIWGVGFKAHELAYPLALERGENMLREMKEQYFNHPCIIIWGIHNEIESGCKEGYEMSKRYYAEMKKADAGNRLVTYASRMPMTDICFEFCDIICINLYHGWYQGDKYMWNKFVKEFRERRAQLGFENKPVIMSEFGAAALYGHHTFDNIKWCEEYQADLIGYALDVFKADDMMCGYYVWQFFDMRTAAEASINRARGFNNKGLLNEYRKPKMAYFAVRERYTKWKFEN